ncbi:MAG: sulfatase-like hydrolase/transferase [Bacteroidales bacterium]|nr:sulfatase-like hydrolase/transferase [Bacteroidales bacterium]
MNRQIFHRPIPSLLFRLLAVLILYSVLRILFYAFNPSFFPDATVMSFIYGIRFDITAILYTNIAVILLMLVPSKVVAKKWYGIMVAILFVICNTFAFALNLLDVGYFPFSHGRSTFYLFDFVSDVPNMGDLAGVFLVEYWYLLLILIAMVAVLVIVVKFTSVRSVPEFYSSPKNAVVHVGARLVILALSVVGIRGGVQLKPIGVNTAAAYESGRNTDLILNTPFSVIRTIGMKELEEKHYFETDEEAYAYFSPIKERSENNTIDFPAIDNVVIIMLEGISSEYSEFLAVPPRKNAGYTPFIDSLARNSIVFRGKANGLLSIVALSSVLGSVPSLFDTPFSKSKYITNRIDYPTKLIAGKGYRSAFFHGASNGTMGFTDLCKVLDVGEYYGLDEYPDKDDYDGTWGIPDYQYLQYVADVIDGFDSKFVATIFTLSSHHPFIVPDDFDSQLPRGDFPMQHTVAYTDMALQKFFDKISKCSWFDRTLFVITADHTNFTGSQNIDYERLYDVPMIFYHPKQDTAFVSDKVMQQIDIMPSVISCMGIDGHYNAFGNNVFDTLQTRFAVYRNDDYCCFMLDGKKIRLYDNDSMRLVGLVDGSAEITDYEQNFMKAFVQCYNNGMRNNTLHSE